MESLYNYGQSVLAWNRKNEQPLESGIIIPTLHDIGACSVENINDTKRYIC